MTPERGGDGGAAPRLCHPGSALAVARPRAKCSLLPPGSGTWEGGSSLPREPERGRGGSAAAPRCAASRGSPAPRCPPSAARGAPEGRDPSQRTTPSGGRERTAGGPAGSRVGSETYLGPRGARAEPRPGRAGGRGRGARAAGALPSSPAFSAAALGAGGERCTIPRGRREGAGRRDPRDFLLQGVNSEPLAQRPRRW